MDSFAVDDWVYMWGKHMRLHAISDDGTRVQLVPEGRKPHPFDWVNADKVRKYGKPSAKAAA